MGTVSVGSVSIHPNTPFYFYQEVTSLRLFYGYISRLSHYVKLPIIHKAYLLLTVPKPAYVPQSLSFSSKERKALQKARVLRELDKRLFGKIREALFQVLLLLLVLIICLSNRDEGSYQQNRTIKGILPGPSVSLQQ